VLIHTLFVDGYKTDYSAKPSQIYGTSFIYAASIRGRFFSNAHVSVKPYRSDIWISPGHARFLINTVRIPLPGMPESWEDIVYGLILNLDWEMR
jgi:hypothetical protein